MGDTVGTNMVVSTVDIVGTASLVGIIGIVGTNMVVSAVDIVGTASLVGIVIGVGIIGIVGTGQTIGQTIGQVGTTGVKDSKLFDMTVFVFGSITTVIIEGFPVRISHFKLTQLVV